jgi:uncharacterized protein
LRPAGLVLLSVTLLAACGGKYADAPPVEDSASLLTPEEESTLADWHAALLAQYDIDFRILTVRSADDLGRVAADSFESAGVGDRSRAGRGLLLVVDTGGERVRLEVARPLEGIFVDSFVAYVEREQMAPFFAAARVGEGIVAAAELIAGRAEQALAQAEFDERATVATSVGAGAASDARIGGGAERPKARQVTDTEAAEAPEDTVAAYLAAMAAHNSEGALDLYTPESRTMLSNQLVTRAQMDNVVRTYRDCPPPKTLFDGEFAVLLYAPQAPDCAPWLLQRGPDEHWRLDLAVMQRVFRFDTRNRWRVADRGALGPYDFAFDD